MSPPLHELFFPLASPLKSLTREASSYSPVTSGPAPPPSCSLFTEIEATSPPSVSRFLALLLPLSLTLSCSSHRRMSSEPSESLCHRQTLPLRSEPPPQRREAVAVRPVLHTLARCHPLSTTVLAPPTTPPGSRR
jgi:hypothetical protein